MSDQVLRSTQPGYPVDAATRGASRIAGLDLLRLFAAVAVVAFHFGFVNAVAQPPMAATGFPELAHFARYGFLGVDMFFLISGFVIASTAEGRSAFEFAIARVARLYPGFLVAMTATAIIIATMGLPPYKASFVQWAANLTMLAPKFGSQHMDGVYWTIVLEIVFYGWVAIMIATGLYQRRLVAIVAAWLAIAFIAEVVLETKSLRTLFLTEYGPLFASGILLHRIHRGVAGAFEWSMLGFAFVLAGVHGIDMRDHFELHYASELDLGVLWLLHAGIYALFALTLWGSRFIPPSRLAVAMGGLTYPLYLIHQSAGAIVLDRLAQLIGRWAALLLVILLASTFAWAVWRFVEPAGRKLITTMLRRCLERVTLLKSSGRAVAT